MNKHTFAVIGLSTAAAQALAYPTTTHTAITNHAIQTSHLGNQSGLVLEQLDLLEWIVKTPSAPFKNANPIQTSHGNEYFTMSPKAEYRNGTHRFEQEIMEEVSAVYASPVDHSIAALVVRGVIREDDNDIEVPDSDEPDGVMARPFGHFFDPVNNRGLTMFGASLGSSAVNWALEEGSTVLDKSSFLNRENNFRLGRLKESMWRALTGLTTEGVSAAPNGAGDVPANETIRKIYWATTFRLLGNQVHLLQDMAQPQHTRNDAHSGMVCAFGGCLAGHDSFYEKYLHARTIGDANFVLSEGFSATTDQPGRAVENRAPPNVAGYQPSITKFKSYRDFYSASNGGNGIGLADFSNRNFYSAGTNADGSYPLPALVNMAATTYVVEPDKWYWPGSGKMKIYVGNVEDYASDMPQSAPARLTVSGAFDQFMKAKGLSSHTLNTMVYDDMAALLVPRAAGYTTSFVNFLFRGRMVITLPKEGVFALIDHSDAEMSNPLTQQVGFHNFKLQLAAPAEDNNGVPQTLGNGVLTAVLKYRRNYCFDNALSNLPQNADEAKSCLSKEQEVVVSSPANSGNPVSLTAVPQNFAFNFPRALPLNATNVRLQVIYKGYINDQKDELVVATQDVAEPTFVSYLNATDYWKISGRVYKDSDIVGNQALIDKLDYCVGMVEGVKTLDMTCFKPLDITMKLAIGPESDRVNIDVAALKVKKFIRLVMLGKPGTIVPVAQIDSPCYPADDILAEPYIWETEYRIKEGTLSSFSVLTNARGVRGWGRNVCVSQGTRGDPRDVGDTWEVFKNLDDAATSPDPVKINGGFGYK